MYSKAVVLLFDGARYDVFKNLLRKGSLPNIERHLTSNGSFLKGYSSLSTTTGPAHIPFVYGIYPGTANVPGIRWFEKGAAKKGVVTNSGLRSYVGPSSFSMSSDIEKSYMPIYGHFSKSANVFSALDRGCSKIDSNRLQKSLCYMFAHYTGRWEIVDDVAARSVKKYLSQGYDFVFAVFPAIDEITHLYYPKYEKVLKQYRRLDDVVGELFDEGYLDEALVFIVSDHGLSKTHTHIPLVKIAKEVGHSPIYYPRILRRDYNLAIMESGNSMAFVYFLDPVGKRPALYDEFSAIEKNQRFIDRIISQEGIDFVAYRVATNGCKFALCVENRFGKAKLEYGEGGEGGEVRLKIEGANPLEFCNEGAKICQRMSLDLTKDTNYADSIVQLRQLFSSDRTGDIVVFAKEGFDLRKKHEWPEHKSSHGSLLRSHMEVPICTNAPLKSKVCRTVDVFPTILHLLDKKVPTNIDGTVIC